MTDVSSERGTSGAPSGQDRAPYMPGYHSHWALIIGINYTGLAHINPLQNAEADAQAIQLLLRDTFKFPNDQIISLIGANATYDKIREALHDTLTDPARVDVNDRVLIFFAGHGVVRPGRQVNGRAEPEGYILPSDDNHSWSHRIPMQEFRSAWENIPAKHVLCILDACYSGFANLPHRAADDRPPSSDNSMTQYEARQIITAGTSEQRVADVFRTGDVALSQHSYLTHFLVDALEKGLPDGQPITAERLYEYLRESVIQETQNRQRPQFGSYGHQQGDVLLDPPNVLLPRNIYEGLRSTVEPVVQNAIIELRQLFNRVVKLEQPGVTDSDVVESWRSEFVLNLLEVLASSGSDMVLGECGSLLRDVLIGSPALQSKHAEQLVAFLGDQRTMRVQQAAIILSALAGDNPAQSAVANAVSGPAHDSLESAFVQGDAKVLEPALRMMVKFFPSTALPWLRLMLMDSQAADDLHFLVFEAIPALGNTIDVRLIRLAFLRRAFNVAYRSRAAECMLSLLAELRRKDTLDQTSLNVANEVLEYALRYDSSANVRRRALEAMVLTENRALIPLLSSALADPSASLRESAYALLAQLPITDSQIDGMLNSGGEWLSFEPLAVVRATICTALGEIWKKTATLPADSPLRISRVATLAQLLSDALVDISPEVQRAAARALGVSGDLAAVETIRGYVSRGLLMKRAIAPMLEDLTDPHEIEQISRIVPQMLPEHVESFQQLQTAASIDNEEKGRTVVANVQLMLEAAQVFGEPAFLPLVQTWLQDPPQSMTTDQGELNARASLYIAAVQALGQLPRNLAMPLAQEQVTRALAQQQQLLPALRYIAEALAALGGADALAGLVELLDSLQLPDADTEPTRIAAASGILRVVPTVEVPDTIRQRLQSRANSDPSERVCKILGQIEQFLPQTV